MAAASNANGAKTLLKLMVHKEENRVIFAEADSVFVDALFSLMTLPIGTIVRLLEKCPDEKLKASWSLKNVYQSLVDLPENFLSTEESRVMMLSPRSSAYDLCRKLKLNIDDTEPVKYYICPITDDRRCFNESFSTCSLSRCSKCGHLMNHEIIEKDSKANAAGGGVEDCLFVSDGTTYIVTDDLRVVPNTAGFGIQLLCDLGFTDAKCIEEMTFVIGIEQILLLLKGALFFKHSLTYMVFNSTRDHDQELVKHRLQTPIHCSAGSKDNVTCFDKVMLKLHLQKSTSKLLFAEAEEDFVDFVLGFLEIPLGTIIGKLMGGNSSVESLDNLYSSISNMDVGYIKSQDLKDVLLQPLLAWHHVSRNKIFSLNVLNCPNVYRHYYISNGIRFVYLSHVEKQQFAAYPSANERCDRLTFKEPRLQGRIFKAPAAKFMMTDELAFTPSSSISTIGLLNKLNVSVDDVEEQEVSIGIEEGLRILNVTSLSDALIKANEQSKPKKLAISADS